MPLGRGSPHFFFVIVVRAVLGSNEIGFSNMSPGWCASLVGVIHCLSFSVALGVGVMDSRSLVWPPELGLWSSTGVCVVCGVETMDSHLRSPHSSRGYGPPRFGLPCKLRIWTLTRRCGLLNWGDGLPSLCVAPQAWGMDSHLRCGPSTCGFGLLLHCGPFSWEHGYPHFGVPP